MADYFLVLDGADFEERIRPVLGTAWRLRSFEPCRDLCLALVPTARAYAERYHTGADEPLLQRVAEGLPFDRVLWRALVEEVLLFTAREIPEFQTCPETLCCLLAPEHDRDEILAREQLAPIQQAHRGARDLTFHTAVYRPEHAGYNNREDVARLSDYLASVRPETWTVDQLRDLPELEEDEERAEELDFAREWFPALRDLYRQCREQDRVLVIESIY